jgi:tripartite-type tricarboxylate transporter receptor subunit TctC
MDSNHKGRSAIKLSRRSALIGAAAIVGTLPASLAIGQLNYPTRSVRIILPFGPGGVTDVITRLLAEKLSDKYGQRFVIENMPGAGGIAAARTMLGSPPDGHTLTLATNGTAITIALFKSLPFDAIREFEMVSMMALFDAVFAVTAESPFRTLQDFIAAAREQPGKLNVGTIVVGSSLNLAAELFKSEAGVDFQILPFRNSPEVIVALLRNDVQLLVEFHASVQSQIAEKKLRPLATSGVKRSPLTPNVPTVSESGVKGYDVTSWAALVAPKGTPPEIVSSLNQSIREVVGMPEVQKRFAELGTEAQASTPEEPMKRLREDIEKWSKVIEKAGIPKR